MRKSFFILFLLAAILITSACSFFGAGYVKGSGVIETESRSVSDFDSVQIDGAGELHVEQGNTYSLKIEAEDNLLPEIRTSVTGGRLLIDFDSDWWRNVVPTETIRYYLVVPDLDEIEINGASLIKIDGFETDALNLVANGAAKFEIGDLSAETLKVELNGGADFDLDGTVNEQIIKISGAGSYGAYDLQSAVSYVDISGAAEVRIWVTDELDVKVSGASSVHYYGSPHVTQDIEGFSNIQSMGDKE